MGERVSSLNGMEREVLQSGYAGCEAVKLLYVTPRVARVRVETTRLASGKQDANAHCTWHYHDSPGNCPNA
jgi:hypothetical protein